MAKNDGGQAFPSDDFGYGMSLRDWFAGQALAGTLSHGPSATRFVFSDKMLELSDGLLSQKAAVIAYLFADAMLVERDKEG